IEPASDAEGQPDWVMVYHPGPKARAEFASFMPRQKPEAAQPALHGVEQTEGMEERRSEETPGQGSEAGEALLHELIERGILENRARKLLAYIRKEQPV